MTPNPNTGYAASNFALDGNSLSFRLEAANKSQTGGINPDTADTGEDQECMVAWVDRIYDPKRRIYTDVKSVAQNGTRLSPKYGIAVFRYFDPNSALLQSWIEIRREGLRDLLTKILDGFQGLRLSEEPSIIEAQHLYYAEQGLRKKLDEIETSSTGNDPRIGQIKAALKVWAGEFSAQDAAIKTLLRRSTITFDTLWAIFPPSCPVYTLDEFSELAVYQLRGHKVISTPEKTRVFRIEARSLEQVGDGFGWASIQLEVPEFSGAKSISSLPVAPLQFHPDSNVLETLETRGQWRLCFEDPGIYRYNGYALQEGCPTNGNTLAKFQCSGRVVFDSQTLRRTQPMSTLVKPISEIIPADTLSEDQFIFVSDSAYGYSLEHKVWGTFLVQKIEPVAWDPLIWDSVILPEGGKESMLEVFQSQAPGATFPARSPDVNGTGLVVLFTGPSGVGKTLTATAIADKLERPLVALSASQLGYTPMEFKENLNRVLRLAECWDAIVILEDADILLCDYGNGDILQNFIFSNFIRLLDSYRGTLIMTVTETKAIRPALRGRIHVKYSFDELDLNARAQLWKKFIGPEYGQGSGQDLVEEGSAESIDALVSLPLNGREIQNSAALARALSQMRGCKLTVSTVKEVAALSR